MPEQPGLKHDFLPEVVKLGHKEGMKVMGYFCIASNPRWAEMHPELSYGSPIPKAGKVAPKKNRSGRSQVSYEIDPQKIIKDLNVSVKDDGKSTRIVLPDALLKDNPQTLDFEWVVK